MAVGRVRPQPEACQGEGWMEEHRAQAVARPSPSRGMGRGQLFAPPRAPRRVDAAEALALLRPLLARWPQVRAEVDDQGDLAVFVRRDMLHLDADALHDRLHHWTLREARPALPAASATLSFHRARPAAPEEESEKDYQEGWLDLEPTLHLEMRPAPTRRDVETLASLVPRFLALVEAEGRPAGWRSPDVGNAE